jgi:alpha-methylacyl-CoA racemase
MEVCMAGPLEGIRVIEIAGIGPGPFCAMLLADLGAEVLRIDRAERVRTDRPGVVPFDLTTRSRRNLAVDLKHPRGVETVLRLVERADVLTEGFRPGVMERLGLGPEVCLARNPRLVYGRMTGWGQDGPMANAAGHDINYIALAGALAHFGRAGQKPTPPLNMVGDFGGGGIFLAMGLLAALLERARSGRGQVVDAAMIDGAAVLMTMIWGLYQTGSFDLTPGTNLLDSGAHFYEVYETSDGKYISLGSIEPQFYAELLERIGVDPAGLPAQMDGSQWPAMKQRFEALFRTRTRDEWCRILETTDVCFAPVLTLPEAAAHPHARARTAFVEVGGTVQPAPAPRFSRTPLAAPTPPARPGQHSDEALRDWGFDARAIAELREAKAIA